MIGSLSILYPNVAKAGGLQSQGAEGEAVILYCEPLATLVADPVEDGDLELSGFPVRVNNMAKSALSLEFTIGDIKKTVHDPLYRE